MRKWILTGLLVATVTLSSSNSEARGRKKVKTQVEISNATIVLEKLDNLSHIIDSLNKGKDK